MSPYRQAAAADVLEAPTRDGLARLEIAPDHTLLRIARRYQISVTSAWATVLTGEPRRRPRPRSLPLGEARLVVARGVPTEEVALWYEERPGVVGRVVGLRPPELLDDDALAAWRALDRLAARLAAALAPHAGDVRRSYEFGRGQHRVLLMDRGDRLVVYARPIFRERPRRCFEVRRDGTVVLPTRGGDVSIRCTSRFGVTVAGDRIRFEDDRGDVELALYLPWVSPADRDELAARLAAILHREPA